MSDKVYICDEITVQEGRSAALSDAYLGQYAPAARERGMTLEGAWRSPALAVEGRLATLHFLWSVPDVAAWWGMRHSDDNKASWWGFVDSVAQSRKRTFMREIAGAMGEEG